METEVRKAHIGASNKGRSDQQSYGSHCGVKGPANDHKNPQRDQNMVGTNQE